MRSKVSEYLAKIGAKGGKKSKRRLTKKQAKEMAKKRWSTRRRGSASGRGI